MRINIKSLLTSFFIILLFYFMTLYKIPYYIYKPGSADSLENIVTVENDVNSSGNMHLVTVSSGQATPIGYLMAKMMPNYELRKEEDIFPEGIHEDEYFETQLHLMESSQEAAIVVAYEKAEAHIDITYNGVYVLSVLDDMPAKNVLKPRDEIYKIDEVSVKEADDLIDYVQTKKAGDSITLYFKREGDKRSATLNLAKLDEEGKQVGMGIQLVTNREVTVDPDITFSSGKIGGSSAGLMFSLEIYDQLTGENLTRNKKVAGTGEVDYEGNVYAIGGVDKKVVAADKANCEIFFVPNEKGAKKSNYEVAKKKADEINTSMKIVPVDHFDDALLYLQKN